jgi:transcriptional regulator with XRE-family HTH domain
MTGDEFQAIRLALGLSPEGLAKALSDDDSPTTRATIWRYENGRMAIPASVALLLRAAQKFAGVRSMLGIPALRRRYEAGRRGRLPNKIKVAARDRQ